MSSDSTIRTYGLSNSGIDVNALVTQLMTAARKPYNALEQKQTLTEYKKEAYSNIYTSINDFNNNTVSNFQLQKTLSPRTVSSSAASVATITAAGDAPTVSHSLAVTQVASGITESSNAAITTGSSKNTMATQFGLTTNSSVMINGVPISIDRTKSINSVVSAINNSTAGVTASYDTITDRFFLYSNNTGSASGIDFTGTNAAGSNFLTQNLKLNVYSSVDSTGITSSDSLLMADSNATLQSQFAGLSGVFQLNVNGNVLKIDTATDSIQSVMKQINKLVDDSGNKIATASYDNGKFTVKANNGAVPLSLSGSDAASINFLNQQLNLKVDSSTAINAGGLSSSANVMVTNAAALSGAVSNKLGQQFSGLSGSFNLNIYDGTTTSKINIDTATDSIQSIMDKINGLKDSSGQQFATASFKDGKFTLQSKNSGTTLDLSGSDAAAMNFLTNQLELNVTSNKKGQDAKFKLDGVSMTEAKNQFTVAGISYSLLSTGTTTASVALDTDAVVKNMQSFVDAYNKVLGSLNSKVNEKYDVKYPPLTDEQRSSMSDTNISLWTDKAKTGLLQNNSILRSLSQAMQNTLTNSVQGISGQYTTAASLGITTGDWTQQGKLSLDSEKLKAALLADSSIAYKIFGTTGPAGAASGIAVQLNGILTDASKSIVAEAGTSAAYNNDKISTLGRSINDMTTQLKTMNDKLDLQQDRYYNQFSAMETALSKLNSQTTYLSSMLGG